MLEGEAAGLGDLVQADSLATWCRLIFERIGHSIVCS
jgi:hypothetical protein